jgi:hypothetical protein
MIEALSTWTTEINGWNLIGIFLVLIGMALVGYASGVSRGTEIVDERLEDLGILTHPTQNLINIHDPADDKLVLTITWDDEEVVFIPHSSADQEWSPTD